MEFSKSSLKKQIEVVIVDGNRYTVEVLDGKFQGDIKPGDTIESMRAELHTWVDRKFNDLMAADARLMPKRLKEAEQLALNGFFDDQNRAVSDAVHDFIESMADVDVTLTHKGRSVQVPKPPIDFSNH